MPEWGNVNTEPFYIISARRGQVDQVTHHPRHHASPVSQRLTPVSKAEPHNLHRTLRKTTAGLVRGSAGPGQGRDAKRVGLEQLEPAKPHTASISTSISIAECSAG